MFMCKVNMKEIPFTGVIQLNGYNIGDRLLEDVYFIADVNDGVLKEDTVRIRPDHAQYFEKFNEKKWLAEMLEHIKSWDLYEIYTTDLNIIRDSYEGHLSGDDVWQN